MKKIVTTILGVMCAALLLAQSPQAFKYQAVIRNNQGKVLVNQLVSLQISILQDNPMGDVVYMETHQVATNDYGIANITIGNGEVVTGVFADIPWGTNIHFVKTELDITGNRNYEFIGTSQLLSVPYALYAEKAGSANNANDDFDKDPTNELQVLSLEGNILTLSNGNTIDLSKYLDNTDQQTLSIDNNQLSISGGNTVTIDANNRDEIQALHFSNDTLCLSDGGYVYLGAYWDNTDNQTLSVSGNSLSISGGNSVQFDTDSTNEIQAISFSNDTLYLSNGGMVYLGAYWDNTDSQTLSIEGNELIISGGNSVVLSGNVDMDSDPTNELQTISRFGTNISLSLTDLSVSVEDDDSDATNELQTLSKDGSIISLTDGGSVTLLDDDALNEIQTISLTNDDLTLNKNGGSVDLSGYVHVEQFNTLKKNYDELVELLRKMGLAIQDTTNNGISQDGYIENALFSVSESKKVRFSRGNLLWSWIDSGTDGVNEYSHGETILWKFAEEQFFINEPQSDNKNEWKGKLAWGGSGYNGSYPDSRDFTEVQDIEGTNFDWGLFNQISNGGNQFGLWRSMSQEEWRYLLYDRPDAANKILRFAYVNEAKGTIILPDDWDNKIPLGCPDIYSGTNVRFSIEQWHSMQRLGAVFLPYNKEDSATQYWTTTCLSDSPNCATDDGQCEIEIGDLTINATTKSEIISSKGGYIHKCDKNIGIFHSGAWGLVRLVQDVEE